jgi:uncharacterized protein (TIGR00299 family) protein
MVLGALIDAGLSVDSLRKELTKLSLSGYRITTRKTSKQGIKATRAIIQSAPENRHRSYTDIEKLISESKLDRKIKEQAHQIFSNLGKAEETVHGVPLENIHFHEIGAADSIIDIVGASISLKLLDIKEVYSSALPVSQPAPATLEIIKEIPVSLGAESIETVTPTGAAIIKTITKSFGETPAMKITSVGYGAGAADLETPNVLRVLIGEPAPTHQPSATDDPDDEVFLLETNVDDATPEIFGYTMERLLDEGALDVWFTPIFMKKNRPAMTLSALVPIGREKTLAEIVFKEIGTFGVRLQKIARKTLAREEIQVETEFGPVRVKIGKLTGKIVSVSPEYEDCAKLARKAGKSLREIYEVVKNLTI